MAKIRAPAVRNKQLGLKKGLFFYARSFLCFRGLYLYPRMQARDISSPSSLSVLPPPSPLLLPPFSFPPSLALSWVGCSWWFWGGVGLVPCKRWKKRRRLGGIFKGGSKATVVVENCLA